MLKDKGNLITEGIPLTRDLLEFAKINDLRISLKTGDYGVEMSESVNRLYPYDNSLVEQVHQLFISGNLYPPDYYEIFNLSNANMIIHILRKFYDMKGKGVMDIYRERILRRREDTVMGNWGVKNVSQAESVKQSKEETCLINWHVRNPSQSPVCQENRKATCRRRFGHDYANSAQSVKDMKAQNSFDATGCYTIFTSPEFRKRSREALLSRDGVDHNFRKYKLGEYPEPDYEFIRDRANKLYILQKLYRENPNDSNKGNLISFMMENYPARYVYQLMKRSGFQTPRRSSLDERLLSNILDDMGIEYHTNQYPGFMKGQELDFILPDLNLAIEVNGDYYHSREFWDYYGCDGYENYHANKFIKCRENIKLAMFTGSEIRKTPDLIRSVVESHMNQSNPTIDDIDRVRLGFDEISLNPSFYEIRIGDYTHVYPTNI